MAASTDDQRGITRRGLLGAGAAAGGAALLRGIGPAMPVHAAEAGSGGGCLVEPDLILHNGQIHTMDGDDRNGPWTVVSAVAIKNGRFTAIGDDVPAPTPGTRVVDLQGRTVIPGLVESHTHVLLMGLRPAFHLPLENAFSIADIQQILVARREGRNPWGWWADFGEIPAGRWITSIGGWATSTFAEQRMPTLAELDEAVADRPVFLFNGLLGPAVTNSMGKAFFESRAVRVADNGGMSGADALRAVFLLFELRTFEDELQGHRDMMAYAATLGLTTNMDAGVFPNLRTPVTGHEISNHPRNPANWTYLHEDEYLFDNAIHELDRRGELIVRVRINYLHQEEDPNVPLLRARLNNVTPFWGNDMLGIVGIGEFNAGVSLFPMPTPAWVNGTREVAKAGWKNENHGVLGADSNAIITGWELVNRETPLDGLRWTLAHAWGTNASHWDRLAEMGCAINFLTGYQGNVNFPLRSLWNHGIKAGWGADGPDVAPLNPWQNIFSAVTGRNVRRQLQNENETITRAQALRWYTSETGWFSREEDTLGRIGVGYHADLVVLNEDYFTVDEDRIDRLHSIFTIVGGKITHDAGVLTPIGD